MSRWYVVMLDDLWLLSIISIVLRYALMFDLHVFALVYKRWGMLVQICLVYDVNGCMSMKVKQRMILWQASQTYTWESGVNERNKEIRQ